MRVNDAINLVRDRTLKARSLYTAVSHPRFEQYFEAADEATKIKIMEILKDPDIGRANDDLSKLMKNIPDDDFHLLNMRDLRLLAQRLGVQHYNVLTKPILLSCIRNAKHVRQNVSVSDDGQNQTQTLPRPGDSSPSPTS